MPLAKLVYDKYWSTSSIYAPMGNYLVAAGYADGALMPGRPIADPGPDRVIKSNTTTLSAAMSLFSSTYSWRVTSGAATLSNATSAQPVFTATGGPGTYTVELVTSNGTAQSAAKTLNIKVDPTLATDPAALRFSDIKDILQLGAGNCVNCHVSTKNPATQSLVPPVYYDDYDRSGTGNAATNLNWFYNDVRSRINFTDIVASPLLRKPAGKHHGGGTVALSGFDSAATVGSAGRADYDKVVSWILNGAPQ
jgi:mono/diheme cytochrome c family protein